MEKITAEYSRCKRLADAFCESSADYALPDYNGEMRKVLYAGARVLPSAKFLDGDTVNSSGIVVYDFIYLNGDGKLDRISFNSDYELTSRTGCDNPRHSALEASVSGFSYRLLGPRRVSAKATVSVGVSVVEPRELVTECCAMSDAETAGEKLFVSAAVFAEPKERELAETLIRFDGAIADEVEVLYTSVSAYADTVKAEESGFLVKGSATVASLIKVGSEPPMLYKKKIPFEELVSAPEVNETMSALPKVTVTSERCEVVADEDGTSVNASVILEVSGKAYYNQPLEVIKDAYLKTHETENTYEKFVYTVNTACEMHSFDISEKIPLSELSLGEVREVVFISGVPKLDVEAVAGSTLTVMGELRCSVISMSVDESGEESYSSAKFSLPIKQNVTLSSQIPQNSDIDVNFVLKDIGAVVDEESIYVDASMIVEVCVNSDMETERLASLSLVPDGEIEPRRSVITVYYTSAEDTLFGVAKKFRTSPEKIAADNALTESVMKSTTDSSSLLGVKRLIIK